MIIFILILELEPLPHPQVQEKCMCLNQKLVALITKTYQKSYKKKDRYLEVTLTTLGTFMHKPMKITSFFIGSLTIKMFLKVPITQRL